MRDWERHTLQLTEEFASDLTAEQLVGFCSDSARAAANGERQTVERPTCIHPIPPAKSRGICAASRRADREALVAQLIDSLMGESSGQMEAVRKAAASGDREGALSRGPFAAGQRRHRRRRLRRARVRRAREDRARGLVRAGRPDRRCRSNRASKPFAKRSSAGPKARRRPARRRPGARHPPDRPRPQARARHRR